MTPIPATLPGLLRRGTGVILPDGRKMTVHATDIMGAWGSTGGAYLGANTAYAFLADLVLDTDNATTRAHLAWWILAQPGMRPTVGQFSRSALADVLRDAAEGRDLSAPALHTLTTVARHLAGLDPA